VFCSFDPEEMRLSENPAKGLELLKQYLSIARDGSQPGTDTSGDLAAREPTAPDHHRADIAAALRGKGLRVRENVGLSKFRIDMTVGAAGGGDWDVAVLLDGPGWAARSTAYDRDALPPNVLTIMGWPRVARIWLPSWIQESERVIDHIAGVVEAANAVPPPPPLTAPPLSAPLAGTPLSAPFVEPLAAAPPPSATGAASPAAAAGFERPFVAAPVSPLGDRDVFERLPDPVAMELIRSAIDDTIRAEAPVHATRLAKVVLTRFGFDRVTAKKTAEILDLATNAQVRRSPGGVFIWSPDVDPATWQYYRRTPPGIERKLDHIAPEEITNAMLDIATMSHTIDREELIKVVAEIFGFRKVTPTIGTDLVAVIDAAVAGGRLVDEAGRLRANGG